MVFYMHDWQNGLNVTVIPVGGSQKKQNQWSTLQFGTIFEMDDKLTVSTDRNSTQIGRAQGIYVNSAAEGDETALHLLLSIVFTNKEFNGSTLEIQGADRIFQKQREVEPGNFDSLEGMLLSRQQVLMCPIQMPSSS